MNSKHATAWLLGCLLVPPLHAAEGYVYGLLGSWSYVPRGTVTSGSQLDFQRDLGLKTEDRREYLLGYQPASTDPRWLPSVDLAVLRLSARGSQQIAGIEAPLPGLAPVFGLLPLPDGTTAEASASIDDLEARLHWPWQWRSLVLSGGVTLSYLAGEVIVADAETGERDQERIQELFPQPGLGLAWQPLASLRLSLRGDYVQYQKNRAQALEASLFWRLLGPVGLEAGWRQRRFKVESGDYLLDTRLSGYRIGLRFEIPR